MTQLPVAVDAMGGDNAPSEIIAGALRAAGEGIAVSLIGRREQIEPLLGDALAEVVDAREVVEMHEHPASAVRGKRDS